MKISVIIGTKDREESLKETLASLCRQGRRPDEILLIDDGNLKESDWRSWSVSQRAPLQYFKKEKAGLTVSRNLGVKKTHGDILLFLDDDVILEPDYLQLILDIYERDPEKTIGGVGGVLLVKKSPLKNLLNTGVTTETMPIGGSSSDSIFDAFLPCFRHLPSKLF